MVEGTSIRVYFLMIWFRFYSFHQNTRLLTFHFSGSYQKTHGVDLISLLMLLLCSLGYSGISLLHSKIATFLFVFNQYVVECYLKTM